jgi:hypothetical protein
VPEAVACGRMICKLSPKTENTSKSTMSEMYAAYIKTRIESRVGEVRTFR